MTIRLDVAVRWLGGADWYGVGWFDDDDDIMQGDLLLGEECAEDEEHEKISAAVKQSLPPDESQDGFLWDSEKKAKRAASLANKLYRAMSEKKPWPDWAAKAHAEGWKPPRGWRP